MSIVEEIKAARSDAAGAAWEGQILPRIRLEARRGAGSMTFSGCCWFNLRDIGLLSEQHGFKASMAGNGNLTISWE